MSSLTVSVSSPTRQSSAASGGSRTGQIKTRTRVRELAEVYTHEREVHAMLDMIPDAFTYVDIRFLEPACGSGNFLVEVLRRKLSHASALRYRNQDFYEHRLLRCVASVYGIDICPNNVADSRARIQHVVLDHYTMDANTWLPTDSFASALEVILGTNIVRGDTLRHPEKVRFIEYRPGPGATFIRVPAPLLEPQFDRFHSASAALPAVHFSQLAEVSR